MQPKQENNVQVGYTNGLMLMVGAVVLYFAMIGPLSRYYDSFPETAQKIVQSAYKPLEISIPPGSLPHRFLMWYADLWRDEGQSARRGKRSG